MMGGFYDINSNGKPLAVLDEGISITTDAESLDFVGAGVTATGDADVTATIAGGSGYTPSTVQITNADSPYTPSANGEIIEVDSSSGAVTIATDSVASPSNWEIGVVITTGGNDVTINAPALTLTFEGDGRTLYHNGTAWKARMF